MICLWLGDNRNTFFTLVFSKMDLDADDHDTAGSFNWTKEKLSFLVDSFAAEPLLWDPNHSDYYSHPARLQVYSRMGETLGCDG